MHNSTPLDFELSWVELRAIDTLADAAQLSPTEGMMINIIWILLEIYFSFQQWKNFEIIDKVIAILSLV